jgi:flagellar motor switch protein FliN/FliY
MPTQPQLPENEAAMEAPPVSPTDDPQRLEFILDIALEVAVELGRGRMEIQEILHLGPGSVIELGKLAGEPLDVLVNGRLMARGEAVIVGEKFGVRITEVVSRGERIAGLRGS